MIVEYPCLHFHMPTEWLGRIFTLWSQRHIQNNSPIAASFKCHGEVGGWFKFISSGARVEVYEMFDESDDQLVFKVEHTGDGLTFQFASNKKLTTPAKIVASHVRDYASNQRHLA